VILAVTITMPAWIAWLIGLAIVTVWVGIGIAIHHKIHEGDADFMLTISAIWFGVTSFVGLILALAGAWTACLFANYVFPAIKKKLTWKRKEQPPVPAEQVTPAPPSE
jgi:hypothetical protein